MMCSFVQLVSFPGVALHVGRAKSSSGIYAMIKSGRSRSAFAGRGVYKPEKRGHDDNFNAGNDSLNAACVCL